MTNKELEAALYNYKATLISIENAKLQIETIDLDCSGIKAVTYEEKIVSSNERPNGLDNKVIFLIEKKEKLKYIISKKQNQIKVIDNAFKVLTELEKEVLSLYYIQGQNWDMVSSNVSYSIRHCQKKKQDAMDKLLSVISGGLDRGCI